MSYKFGSILYIIGIAGAILVGLLSGLGVLPNFTWIPLILVIAGLLIGIFNVTSKEAVPIMVASLVLGAGTGILAILPMIGGVLEAILGNIAQVAIAAGVVIAFMTILKKAS